MKFDNLIMLVIFLAIVSFGGLCAGVIYYDMNLLDATLRTVNFDLPIQNNVTANANLTDFQDVLGIVVYPLLSIKSALPFLTYFMVFAFILALGVTAYVGSKNGAFFVVHLLFLFLMSYFAIILSNTYIQLLTDPFINSMMVSFTIYNKLMIYLPQVMFFTGLVFGVIAFINLMKPQSSDVGGTLNYGGDY